MMYWYGHGMNGWGYALMTAGTILFLGLVLAGVMVLVHHLTHEPRADEDTPERILAERLARDEIDEQGYRSRLATLRGGPAPQA